MLADPRAAARPLVEVLLVVCLMAALVGVAVPFFQDNLSESQQSKAGQDLEVLKKAWSLRQAREPITRGRGDLAGLSGTYLQELPKDPWGRDYVFDPATNTLRSHGADASPGGSGGDMDIVVALGPTDGFTWMGARAGGAALTPEAAARLAGGPALRDLSRFVETARDPLSTFGLDVDTGSYSLTRRLVTAGRLPPPGSVRIEEFVNALPPLQAPPHEGDFAVETEVAPGTAGELRLVRVGLRARAAREAERTRLSLAFVVDTSGSMAGEERLGLVRWSLTRLSEHLRATDQVALVSFSAETRVVLPLAPLGDGEAFRAAVASLVTQGSTDVGTGLAAGYRTLDEHAGPGGTRRVVLCSDGAANTGVTDVPGLLGVVRAHARAGILLTTLGFGMGGYQDQLMEQLADRGHGLYAYLDSRKQAEAVLVETLTGTLLTVAREARVQVEFDPARVLCYRLLGYQNRALADEDFRRDDVDAGEVGAEHSVTALYEILPAGEPRPGEALGEVRLRWTPASGGPARERAGTIRTGDPRGTPSPALRRSALAAEFAEALGAGEDRPARLRILSEKAPRVAGELPGDPAVEELGELIRKAAALVEAPAPGRPGRSP